MVCSTSSRVSQHFRHKLPRTMSSTARDVEDGKAGLNEKDTLEVDPDRKADTPVLKLDKHGLPLVPQPSDHKDDPLVSATSDLNIL